MKIKNMICAAALISSVSFNAFAASMPADLHASGPGVVNNEKSQAERDAGNITETFDVNRFKLPSEAGLLVVVEGTSGSECNVYVYENVKGAWQFRFRADGHMGLNGMSNNRIRGDKTTPIGVFQMNTPFGQKRAQPGFPLDYIMVDESYVWEDATNSLTRNTGEEGEKVGTSGYKDYYDYVIDFGYNPNAVPDKGSALFLHCSGDFKSSTSGCVAIEKDEMIKVMQLYGKYGSGRCYSALAPAETFDLIYESYGVNNGLSPEGEFGTGR